MLLKKILLMVVLAPFIYFGLIMLASESGEVVVLESQDDQGEVQSTRLWVVDHDGSMWLRAGDDQSGWYQRLMNNVQAGRPFMSPERAIDLVPVWCQILLKLLR